jgi:FkbM family methyltransferase
MNWVPKQLSFAPRLFREWVRTGDMAYARLYWLANLNTRDMGGVFRFRFGEIKYLNVVSLFSQYKEIFVQKRYDFLCEHRAPFILDCGGNIGLSSIRFKQCYPNSRILTFEPDPPIIQVIQQNLQNLHVSGVEIVPAAAWSVEGALRFESNGSDGGRIGTRGEKTVPAVRLADYISQPVDLLKLDIEGAEYDVLLDLIHSGKIGQIRRLICEVHVMGEDRRRLAFVFSGLQESGFQFTVDHARAAPDLAGAVEQTPFSTLRDGKFLMHLYAWQEAD